MASRITAPREEPTIHAVPQTLVSGAAATASERERERERGREGRSERIKTGRVRDACLLVS